MVKQDKKTTSLDYEILELVKREPGLSMAEIAMRFIERRHPGTIAVRIRRLRAQGHIRFVERGQMHLCYPVDGGS
jgi:hypothetical protein